MLRIMVSPAKKMDLADDYPVETSEPRFLGQAEAIGEYLRGLGYGELKKIWKCNDKIAGQNWERLRDMDLRGRVAPAVLAYEGLQYQSMAPWVMSRAELDYIGEHLYILSGFYGILRAFDGVVPYRLEMQARLSWQRGEELVTDLYGYWGGSLYRALAEPYGEEAGQGMPVIINLASKEYSRAVEPWLTPKTRYITCVFGEMDRENGTVKQKATAAKMARGAMVRYMAENQVEEPEQLKAFDRMGYRYLEHLSDGKTFVFGVGKKKSR